MQSCLLYCKNRIKCRVVRSIVKIIQNAELSTLCNEQYLAYSCLLYVLNEFKYIVVCFMYSVIISME